MKQCVKKKKCSVCGKMEERWVNCKVSKPKKRFIKRSEMMKTAQTKEYPETLTCNQSDYFPSFHSFYELEEAQTFFNKHGGVLYTQVDSDGFEDIIYIRGNRLINRTGFYLVLNVEEKDIKDCSCSTCEMYG